MCLLSRRLEIDQRAHVNAISGRIRAESAGILWRGRQLHSVRPRFHPRTRCCCCSSLRQQHGFHLEWRRAVDGAIDRVHAAKSVISSDSLLFNFFFLPLWCVCLLFAVCVCFFSFFLLSILFSPVFKLVLEKKTNSEKRQGPTLQNKPFTLPFALEGGCKMACPNNFFLLFLPKDGNRYQGGERRRMS